MTVLAVLFSMGLISTLISPVQSSAGITTCTTSTANDVRETRTAHVTCHYGTDVISKRPLSLSVEFYPPDKNASVEVMSCEWVGAEGNTTCSTLQKNHYTFTPSTYAPGDMMLTISKVTARDVGRYVCQHISPDTVNARVQTCVLSAEDIPLGPTDTDHADSIPTLGPEMTSDEAKTSEDEGLTLSMLLVAILVPCAVLLLVLVVGCYVYRKRRSAQSSRIKTDEESGSTNPEKHEEETEDMAEKNGLLAEIAEGVAESDEHAPESPEQAAQEDEEGGSDKEEEEVMVNKSHFETEIKITAAAMQIPIRRKMSTGDYPKPKLA